MILNILCVGNSLLHHAPSDEVSWDGDWGMAASCAENDYYHILQKLLRKKYPDVDFEFCENGVYRFESAIKKDEAEDYTDIFNGMFAKSLDKMTPDIVVLQMGDNCPHDETSDLAYAHAIKQAVDYFRKINHKITVVMCLPWYGEMIDSKHIGTLIAARDTKSPYVDLTVLSTDENKALGKFSHTGVQSHPGDRGMEKIAETLCSAISKTIDSNF